MPPLPTATVTAEQAKKLNFGNQIISMVRKKMPYGAGNLAVDVERTRGASGPRTARAYQVHTLAKQGSPAFKPKLLAGIAEKYGAGNCDMAGSMAYTLMRAALAPGYEVMLILNETLGHTYAAFKEVNAPDDTAIIVDPWPTSGMATLAEHHFQGFVGTTILRKPGKWDGVSAARDRVALNERYATLAANIDKELAEINEGIALPNITYNPYGNQLCSTVVGNYQDSNSNPVPLPSERLLLPPPPIPEADAQAVAVDSQGDVIMRDA